MQKMVARGNGYECNKLKESHGRRGCVSNSFPCDRLGENLKWIFRGKKVKVGQGKRRENWIKTWQKKTFKGHNSGYEKKITKCTIFRYAFLDMKSNIGMETNVGLYSWSSLLFAREPRWVSRGPPAGPAGSIVAWDRIYMVILKSLLL